MMVLRNEDDEHIGFVKIFQIASPISWRVRALEETERMLRQAQEAMNRPVGTRPDNRENCSAVPWSDQA